MKRTTAEITREYGPFPGADAVNGVTFDGARIWIATGEKLSAVDPESGDLLSSFDIASHAGTAFDGTHLFQISEEVIRRIDPETGEVLSTIPAPSEGGSSGLAWAEGSLWVGDYRGARIHQVDPETGEVLRTIQSDRFVTGVTWVEGELWHGTWQDERSEIRHVDAGTGEVLECLDMPPDTIVAGLESDGADRFFCGGGTSGKVRTVRRPRGSA